MTEHTEGPWEARIDGPRVRQRMAMVATGGPQAVDCTQSGETWGESCANARLIAAAPDLLAALEAACGYLLNAKIDLETGAPKRTAINTIEGGLTVTRDAIAKARGA